MHQTNLTARMRACIERNIACIEEMLESHVPIEQALADEHVLEQAHARRERDTKTLVGLQQELDMLLKEWREDTSITAEEKAEIIALAARAAELDRRLAETRQHSIEELVSHMLDIKSGLAGLRKGRDMLGKFRSREEPGAGYIDRKA